MNPKRGAGLHAPWFLALHRHARNPFHVLDRFRFVHLDIVRDFDVFAGTAALCVGGGLLCATMVHPAATQKFASGV